MNKYFIFDLTMFCLVCILAMVKQHYHWRYLKIVDSEFRHFKTIFDYTTKTNMNDPSQLWSHFFTTTELLIPRFRFHFQKEKISDRDLRRVVRYIRQIRIYSALYLGTLIALILSFIFDGLFV